jgi:hypothetical protein
MTPINPQFASDFFYAFDNYTLFNLNVPVGQQAASKAMQTAFGDIFQAFSGETGVYAFFRRSYATDPSLAGFKARMSSFQSQLVLVQNDTDKLLQQYLGNASPNFADSVQQAFELFGQGVMYDLRRNTADYDFWTIHGMDSTYPDNPPIGYFGWYTFVRAYSLVQGVESERLLHFARCITAAAAIQNLLKPAGVSGPTHKNPNNPPITPDALEKIRRNYMSLSFAELDQRFATAGADSPLGPPPSAPNPENAVTRSESLRRRQ